MNKQRGFFNITTGEWYFFLFCVGAVGYAVLRGVEWLARHIRFYWHG